MKKLILFYILTIGLCSFSFSQQYGWIDISANIPGNPDLSDLFFVSDNEGWISSSSQAEIYHTSDGGQTFDIQTTQTSLQAIYMINQSEGYTGGGSGFVYRTIDGGDNWNFHGTMATTLTDMDFASDSIGYACGNGGAVFSITSQSVTNLNTGQAIPFSGISSSSDNKVYACGGGSIMFYSGGEWIFQPGPAGSYNTIFFVNDNKGWVGGDSGLLGHTEDGGEDWTQQTNPDQNSLYRIFFLNQNEGWAIGAQGTIIKTTNGGETWLLDQEGSTLAGTKFLRGVHFTSSSNGYIVGNDKTLLKYTTVSGIEEETLALDFEVFPNPCRDKLSIRNLNSEIRNLKLELIDNAGKVVLAMELQGQENTIDVSDIPAGVYFLKLQADGSLGVRKIIIK